MSRAIDVKRLVRIVAVLACVLAGCVVYVTFDPDATAASARVDRAELQLDSDRTAAYDIRALRNERDSLANQYAKLFEQNPEAVFIRALAADAARHGVTLVSTSESKNQATLSAGPVQSGEQSGPFAARQASVIVSLRGTYRNLLATIGELSIGPEIVRVDPPTLVRERASITATIPVTLLEPTAGGPESTPVR